MVSRYAVVMNRRFPSVVFGAVIGMMASCGLAGCNRVGESPSASSSAIAASSSQAPATLDASAAKTASCAVFNKAIVKAQVANNAFIHALDDPKRPQDWNKPMSDAADSAAVVLSYVAKDVESNAIKPQLVRYLADKFRQFVHLARDRADLFTWHKGTDELNGNAKQYDDISNQLIDTCK